MSETVEALRMIQVGLLVVTLAILGGRFTDWWCVRWRCLLPAAGTGAIALFVCGGSVDALLHERPGGLQTAFLTLASAALLLQACSVGHDHEKAHPS